MSEFKKKTAEELLNDVVIGAHNAKNEPLPIVADYVDAAYAEITLLEAKAGRYESYMKSAHRKNAALHKTNSKLKQRLADAQARVNEYRAVQDGMVRDDIKNAELLDNVSGELQALRIAHSDLQRNYEILRTLKVTDSSGVKIPESTPLQRLYELIEFYKKLCPSENLAESLISRLTVEVLEELLAYREQNRNN